MNKEIKNNPKVTKSISKKILELCGVILSKVNSNEASPVGGRTAQYNDKFVGLLDSDLKKAFDEVFVNSSLKFKNIAEDFITSDKNASL